MDLSPCPDSPNCVSSLSETDSSQYIAPFALRDDAGASIGRLARVISQMRGMTVVREEENYLQVESKTLVFRFVDDLEFLVMSGGGQIEVRSASRTGYSDLGKNRRRLEQIRARYMALD